MPPGAGRCAQVRWECGLLSGAWDHAHIHQQACSGLMVDNCGWSSDHLYMYTVVVFLEMLVAMKTANNITTSSLGFHPPESRHLGYRTLTHYRGLPTSASGAPPSLWQPRNAPHVSERPRQVVCPYLEACSEGLTIKREWSPLCRPRRRLPTQLPERWKGFNMLSLAWWLFVSVLV